MSQWPPRSAVHKPFGLRPETHKAQAETLERYLRARLRDVRRAIDERVRLGQLDTPLMATFKATEAELLAKIERLK